jgi:hypothetical protein
MRTFTAILFRDFACAAGAALITLAVGLSFVASTANPPGTHARGTPFVMTQSQHGWFGQPEPAVLVD